VAKPPTWAKKGPATDRAMLRKALERLQGDPVADEMKAAG